MHDSIRRDGMIMVERMVMDRNTMAGRETDMWAT